MLSRYAGVGASCPQFTVTTDLGGSLTGSGSLYFSFQLQNRAGFNVPSVSSQVNYTAGQKIVITIPDTVRKDGWDIHYFVISAGATDDPSTHVAIARYSGYQFGVGIDPQSLLSTLPATIELTRNSHIALAPTVANLAVLPTGNDRLDGQVRWVTSESKWFEYHADSQLETNSNVIAADVGQWVRVASASTYISNSTDSGGSDRALVLIEPTTTIPTPPYPGNNLGKVLPTWEQKYFIYNDTSDNLPEGIEFGIELEYNNLRSPDLLSGLFMVEFKGFVKSDGTLRTTKISDNSEFPNINGYVPWTPKLTTNFLLPDDLLPTESILIAVKPFFSSAELDFYSDYRSGSTGLVSGDIVGIKPVIRTLSGDYNPLGKLLNDGSVVLNLGDRYRVVPSVGLSYKVLSGCALVKSYDFPLKPTRYFSGLVANTANQKVVINGNASVFTEQSSYTIQSSEALRALVSTVSGESIAGSYSGYVANNGSQEFSVTLNYPCTAGGLGTIRSNYSDVIASNNKGDFNPVGINVYIQRQDTLEIRKFTGNLVVPGTSQNLSISNWTDGTIVGSLPNTEFGLFSPSTSSLTATGSGVFPVTSYRVTHSFVYDGNQITDISHTSPPCIYEWEGDLQPPSITVDPSTITLDAGEDVVVENLGTGNQAILRFSIPRGDRGNDGVIGFNAYTDTTVQFTVPNANSNVTISVINSDWMVIGQLIYIQDAGTYEVVSKSDSTSAVVKNKGNQGNAATSTVISTGRAIAPTGATGATGTSGYTTTSAQFTVPNINSTVVVNVIDSGWISVNLIVYVETAGYYKVTNKAGLQITLENLGETGNASPTTVISSGVVISSGGVKGATGNTGATGATGATGSTGSPGQNAFTTTTASFSQPNVGNNVTVSVGNSDWVVIGQTINIYAGGDYKVIDVPDSVSIQIQNLGYPDNAIVGSSINSGSNVSPSGQRGAAGANGSVAATSDLTLTEVGVAPGTVANEIKIYNLNNKLTARLESNGIEIELGNYIAKLILNAIAAPSTGVLENALYFDNADNRFKRRFPENGAVETYAVLGLEQSYSKRQSTAPISQNITGSVTLDGSASNSFYLTVTGIVTSLSIDNLVAGTTYNFRIIQGATPYAVTLSSVFKTADGDTTTISTTANKISRFCGEAISGSIVERSPILVYS